MAAPDQRRDEVTHYSYGEGEGPQKRGPEGLDRSSEGFLARPTEEVEGRHHAPGRARGEGKTCYCRLEREADNA